MSPPPSAPSRTPFASSIPKSVHRIPSSDRIFARTPGAAVLRTSSRPMLSNGQDKLSERRFQPTVVPLKDVLQGEDPNGGYMALTSLPSVDRKTLNNMRTIRETLVKNNVERRLHLLASVDEVDDPTLNINDPEQEFENLNDDFEAISPPDLTPPIPSTRILNSVNYKSLQNESFHGVNHAFHILGTTLALERYLDLPFFAAANGGYFFIIPVIIAQLLVVWPAFLLELSLGQFTGEGPIEIFRNIAPLLKGFSILVSIIRLTGVLLTRSMPIIAAIIGQRFTQIFFGKLQPYCDPRDKYCHLDIVCKGELVAGVCHEMWYGSSSAEIMVAKGRAVSAVNRTVDFDYNINKDQFFINLLFACLLMAVAIYLFSKLHLETRARQSFIYFIGCLLILLAAFPLMYFTPIRFKWELNSDANKLLEPWVWVTAFQWACELMSVGDGTVHRMGAIMPFHFDSISVWSITVSTNLLLICFSFALVVPYMNSEHFDQTKVVITDVHYFIPSLRRSEDNWTEIWLFLLVLQIAFYLSQLSYLAICVDGLVHRFTVRLSKMTQAFSHLYPPIREHCLKFSCLILIMIPLYECKRTPTATYYLHRVITQIALPSALFFEFLIVGYKYGMSRYIVNMQTMYGNIGCYWATYGMFSWVVRYVGPAYCLFIFGCQVLELSPMVDSNTVASVAASALLMLCVFKQTFKYYSRSIPMVYLLQTSSTWGPQHIQQRRRAIFDERAARIFQ